MVVPALLSQRRVVPLLFLTILAVAACRPGDGGPSPTSAATMAVTRTGNPVRTATSAGMAAQTRTPTVAGAAVAAAATYFGDALMAAGKVAR